MNLHPLVEKYASAGLDKLLTETCTIISKGTTTGKFGPVMTGSLGSDVRCNAARDDSDEKIEAGMLHQFETIRLFLPKSTAITLAAEVTYGGVNWKVIEVFRHPTSDLLAVIRMSRIVVTI